MFDCMGYKVKTKLIVKNNKKGRLIAIKNSYFKMKKMKGLDLV